MGLLFGHRSHVGQVRALNEDSYLAMAAPALVPEIDALLVVADGVGGYQAGEVASRHVIDTFRQLFSSPAYRARVQYDQQREDYYAAALKEILEQINLDLQERAVGRPSLSGMGTTATVALVAGERLFIGHVGDTRAYLGRRGQLRQLTVDHSWVQEQVHAGALTPEEAAAHPRRNILTRSLGNRPVVRIDRSIHALESQDTLLLCSDGLTNKVGHAEIMKALHENADLQRACDFLVDLANQRGGQDNITVLLMLISDQTQGSDLPGGIAIGPGRAEVAEEAAATQKIHRRKASARPNRPIMFIAGALLFAAAAILLVLFSALTTAPAIEQFSAEKPWIGIVLPGLWAVTGVLIGMLGAALIPRK